MRGHMPKELSSEAFLCQLKLARRDISLDQARKLVTVATVGIPDSVRFAHDRATDTSTAEGDVEIDAAAESLLTLHAVIRVKLTFEGHLRRPSFPLRKIAARLCEVAGQHCLEHVFKEMADGVRGRK